MVRVLLLFVALLIPAPMLAQDATPENHASAITPGATPAPQAGTTQPAAVPPTAAATPLPARGLSPETCSDSLPHFPSCNLPRQDKLRAKRVYDEVRRLLEDHQYEEALSKMTELRDISPRDAVYRESQKIIAQQIAADCMKRGKILMMTGNNAQAARLFRRALELDPGNDYALQRLQDAEPSAATDPLPRNLMEGSDVRLRPSQEKKSFHYRGGSAQFLVQFAQAFGLRAVQDDSLITRQIKVNLDDVTWDEGSPIVTRMCKAMFLTMDAQQVLVANDTAERRRELVQLELRSFRIEGMSSAQDMTSMVSTLRTMFDVHDIMANQATSSILVKAPQATIDAMARFLTSLDSLTPEVTLDVKVYQISTDLTNAKGVSAPTGFTVFNVDSEVNSVLTSSSYSSIVSELEALGVTVNSSTILAALLASGSSLGTSSVLSDPFATFGGGITLSGITIPSVTAKLDHALSSTVTLEDTVLRSKHGSVATLKVGERYPVVSTQYSSSSSTSSLLSALGISTSSLSSSVASSLATTTTPTAQFQYEDLGLVLKATPHVHGKLISLDYEMTLRSLGSTQVNGLPLMLNRDLKGAISTWDGSPVVLAGTVNKDEVENMSGIPLLSMLPVVGAAFSTKSRETTYDELLILVTPHVVAAATGEDVYIPVPVNNPR
ncbi:MAG: tetratricopeptide repeat protein [Acidobacteriota bacterium]|nr:tetratricopeptide repeat protein [Acidobacteriota bacterium]